MTSLPAFQYPTTVVIVDDNPDFLANIGLQLDPRLALQSFMSPYDGLVAVNGSAGATDAAGRFFAPYNQRDEMDNGRHVISLSLDTIHQEVLNPRRFERVTVAVVDYDMPEIDGLEFCAGIKDSKVGKILLTGKADERTAIKAFNDGLINRFIRKQEPDAIEQLSAAITDLQRDYLERYAGMVSEALAVGAHEFLHNPVFAATVRRLQADLHIVEHYLISKPLGLLMFDAAGNAWRLVVMEENDLRSQAEITQELGAPDELTHELLSGRVVPYFWRTGGEYSPMDTDWPACLYPAQACGKLLYAVIPNPPGLDIAGMVPYGRYLDQMDAKG